MIRVGRIIYSHGGPIYPSYPGFSPIVCLTKSSAYGSLGPYVLKTEEGWIMENIWQFEKCYPKTPAVCEVMNQYDKRPNWVYPETIFTDADGNPNAAYWIWRAKGFNHPYPVRYPVGRAHMHTCLYSLIAPGGERLDYIQARKRIYLPLYCALAQKQTQYHELSNRLQQGENLLIIEVDGPHQESLGYYIEKYQVDPTFIENNTMLATKFNLQIMLNDSKHPFGHGYCLASSLLNLELI